MTQTQNSLVLPPPEPPRLIKWVRDNLFSNWFNTLLSVVSTVIFYFLIVNIIRWTFHADWRPVTQFPLLFAVGQYPRDQLWRVGIGLWLTMLMLGVSWGKWGGLMRSISFAAGITFLVLAVLPFEHEALDISMRLFLASILLALGIGNFIGKIKKLTGVVIGIAWLVLPLIIILFLSGFNSSSWLPAVETTSWGGLLVTFLLAVGSILISFPFGVLLALGRRSSLPVVSWFSTIFIETVRGVPLITILFMFSIILALFLPPETRLDRLLRALIAMTVFSAAYTAENIRGGLQGVPEGQVEAAKALGMSSLQITTFIVLPQAIRAVIPAMVGLFISMFKDTTLVVIVGINDFLGIGKSVINSSPEFMQLQIEVYMFIAIVYWIFSYLMSVASRRVEAALGVGER